MSPKPLHRPYFFEVFSVANLLLIQILIVRWAPVALATLGWNVSTTLPVLLAELAAGVLVRLAVGWRAGTARGYLQTLRSAAWLVDTVRVVFFGIVVTHAYAWIKLMVPKLHPRLFDREIWDAEAALLAGHSPTVLFLNLFSNPIFLRAIDWAYPNFFFGSMAIGFAFILSSPSRRLRIAFSDANALLWIAGAWLYVALPSLGPAYRFPDVWQPFAPLLPLSHYSQQLLLDNYRLIVTGVGRPNQTVQILFGVAAFPSLHVAFEAFMVLWARTTWRAGQLIFYIFTILIFVGSVVTGWHYLIDAIAGIALAIAAYTVFARRYRIARWAELLKTVETRRSASTKPAEN